MEIKDKIERVKVQELKYASAIIERWETVTGQTATKEDLSEIELNSDNVVEE